MLSSVYRLCQTNSILPARCSHWQRSYRKYTYTSTETETARQTSNLLLHCLCCRLECVLELYITFTSWFYQAHSISMWKVAIIKNRMLKCNVHIWPHYFQDLCSLCMWVHNFRCWSTNAVNNLGCFLYLFSVFVPLACLRQLWYITVAVTFI